MASRRYPARRWQQRGLGLPETLIAFTLMLVALTGLLAAHQQAKLIQRDASQRLQAIVALRELSLRWQLNGASANHYRAAIAQGLAAAGDDFRCTQATCSAATRAQADVAWVAAMLKGLSRAQWRIHPCREWLADCLWLGWGRTTCNGQRTPRRTERCMQWLLPP